MYIKQVCYKNQIYRIKTAYKYTFLYFSHIIPCIIFFIFQNINTCFKSTYIYIVFALKKI